MEPVSFRRSEYSLAGDVVVRGAELLDGKKRCALIHFGIVGCGRIAQKHAALCNQFGKLQAICDTVPAAAQKLAEQYGASPYYTIEELLKAETNLTVLVVCTPNGLHPEHTILGLLNGLHIICEKPMAIRVEDAVRMIAASEKAGKELFIIKQNRYNEAVLAVRDILKRRVLGDIYSIQINAFWNRGPEYYENSWHGDAKLDGGILFTQFSHFIDLMYWLLGDMDQVQGYSGNFHPEYEKDFEDTVLTCFRMKSGAIGTGHFTINSYRENMEGSLTIFGEKGTIKIGGKYLSEISYQMIEGETLDAIKEDGKENNYGSYTGSMSNHNKVYAHVVEVLSGSTENQFPGRDGLKSVEIIEKIYKAVR